MHDDVYKYVLWLAMKYLKLAIINAWLTSIYMHVIWSLCADHVNWYDIHLSIGYVHANWSSTWHRSMYMDDQLAYPIGYHDHPYTITCHCICQITCGYDMVTYYELHVIHIPQVHSMTCHHISMFMIWQVDNMFSLWSSISYRDRPWSYIWMIWS